MNLINRLSMQQRKYAIAYKPNLAFYESRGIEGWNSLRKTFEYLNNFRDELFLIADAKRGDIGNTSRQYAKAFFDPAAGGFDFDSVTIAPYMGTESVVPFLSYEKKWAIILALTSNPGAADFQLSQPLFSSTLEKMGIKTPYKKKLFEQVILKSFEWGSEENIMFVIGATKAEMLNDVRAIAPHHFLLVPGVGAQGGSLEEVCKYGMNSQCGLIVNASRSVIFASKGEDFAEMASKSAKELQQQMEAQLIQHKVIE
jgi:orotidine-5'-phosphate decarboxylase